MNKIKNLFLCGLLCLGLTNVYAQHKSFKPSQIWEDNNGVHINAHGGGIIEAEGKYYWFGEHKADTTSSAYVGVTCYSSKDLYNWKNEGVALSVIDRDPTHDITKGSIIERPKVIYNKRTKKYVMWFHLELRGKKYDAARYGVAISDEITGPYKFLYSKRSNAQTLSLNTTKEEFELMKEAYENDNPKKKGAALAQSRAENGVYFYKDFEGGQMSRDMTLFVDDNGKAYHIFSSENNQTLHIVELNKDFTGHSDRFTRVLVGKSNEAPAIFKKKGKYWMIASGCTGWAPNSARLAVADDILGEWKYVKNPCVGENANITFGGQSTYILPLKGKKDAYIFMADIWRPKHPSDARYMWLPIQFDSDGVPFLEWMDEWNLSFFEK